ncbi:unnamed protein product, partial [Nesidiocoris tenuis]
MNPLQKLDFFLQRDFRDDSAADTLIRSCADVFGVIQGSVLFSGQHSDSGADPAAAPDFGDVDFG